MEEQRRAQRVESTQVYTKAFKKLGITDKVDRAVKSFLLSFNFTITTRTDLVFKTPRDKAEIWEIRVGDPDKKKGASGGYRLLAIYVVEEQTFFLDYINLRANLNKPKEKQDYNSYLRALKGEVQKTYDPR